MTILEQAEQPRNEHVEILTERVNVRLLRYTRAGLLNRRRREGRYEYEYRLSPKGVDRYISMLKVRGLLDPNNAKTPEEKETMLNRIAIAKLLRMRQKRRLEPKLTRLGYHIST